LIQDGIVPRKQYRHLSGMFLRKPGTAFDVGKKESNGAGREFYATSLSHRL
jgi:hypothetical protein